MAASSSAVGMPQRIEDLTTEIRVVCGLVGVICLYSVVDFLFLVVFAN